MTSLALIIGAATMASLPTGKPLAALCVPSVKAGLTDKDGSTTEDWGGTGQVQVRISKRFMEQRDEQLNKTGAIFAKINTAIDELAKSPEAREARAKLKAQFAELSGKPLDEAEQHLLQYLFGDSVAL